MNQGDVSASRHHQTGAGDLPAAPPALRRRWVREVFQSIAGRYDLLNYLLSGGIDALWRRAAVEAAALRPGGVAVDICCGTGDLLLGLAGAVGPTGRAVGIDFAPGMLTIAARRARGAGRRAAVSLVSADAEALPLPDACADAATFGFGLRNVIRPAGALREACRVLQPGGRLVVLEFGQPRGRLFRWLYDLYSRAVIPRVGGWLSGRPDAYQYLHDSIRQWPDPSALAEMMDRSGFVGVRYRLMTGGIAVLHVGVKAGPG